MPDSCDVSAGSINHKSSRLLRFKFTTKVLVPKARHPTLDLPLVSGALLNKTIHPREIQRSSNMKNYQYGRFKTTAVPSDVDFFRINRISEYYHSYHSNPSFLHITQGTSVKACSSLRSIAYFCN